ncbi:MAG: rod-binding protein [Selenomonadaceae bacterium]|nr:rod-binding protein [Selenomonadaceae bacterium]
MEINGISDGLVSNNTYDTLRMAADSAKFADALKEAQAKTESTATEKNTRATQVKLQEACQGFETMFLQMMYRQMRSTVPENDLFGKSHALKIFEEMRDDELMKSMAAGGGIGLGNMLYNQLEPQVLAQAKTQQ